MSRSSLTRFCGRSALVVGGSLLAATLPAAAALAAVPTAPSNLVVTLTGSAADLSWSDGDGVGAIVRDVTGLSSPFTPTSGRSVVTTDATHAHDTGFVNSAKTTYALWSTDSDSTPSTSPLVQAVSLPTSLTLQTSNTQVGFGVPLNVAGVLTRWAGSVPVPAVGAAVDLVGLDGGSGTPRVVRHLTTDANGHLFTTIGLYRNIALHLVYAGDAFSGASTSATRLVTLVPKMTAVISPATIKQGEQAAITGHVSPLYANERVLLQRFSGGAWHSLVETRTSGTGAYRFVVNPGTGVYSFRAVLAGSPAWVAAGSAAAVLHVVQRDLVNGNVGDDVLQLKRSLAALHYQPGSLTTTFGTDLTHAVIAFQKLERLPRTGRWGAAERARIAHPTTYVPRFSHSGRAVEVDITRQVLVYSENHVVKLIVDVSSGGEYYYTYKGVRDFAHTPRGHYTVQRKIDGVRISNLGYLYRPAYFTGGYAVHGEGYDVPSHPASHGCVRVTNPNMNILFPLLAKGTAVDVFDE